MFFSPWSWVLIRYTESESEGFAAKDSVSANVLNNKVIEIIATNNNFIAIRFKIRI